MVRIAYVPEWKTDAEQTHLSEVQRDMTGLKSTVDMIIFLTAKNTGYSALSPLTVPFSMGRGELSTGTIKIKRYIVNKYKII